MSKPKPCDPYQNPKRGELLCRNCGGSVVLDVCPMTLANARRADGGRPVIAKEGRGLEGYNGIEWLDRSRG